MGPNRRLSFKDNGMRMKSKSSGEAVAMVCCSAHADDAGPARLNLGIDGGIATEIGTIGLGQWSHAIALSTYWVP